MSRTLMQKLAVVKEIAPPHPTTALYAWLTKVYRLRRTLGDAKGELRSHGQKARSNGGDALIRVIIDRTAGDHVSSKMKWKYAVVLEKALKRKVNSTDLREFIEGEGGINRCSGAPKAKWPKF